MILWIWSSSCRMNKSKYSKKLTRNLDRTQQLENFCFYCFRFPDQDWFKPGLGKGKKSIPMKNGSGYRAYSTLSFKKIGSKNEDSIKLELASLFK